MARILDSRVCLVGIFPPPLSGMSLINKYMENYISSMGNPLLINYSPGKLDRTLMTFFLKLNKVIYGLIRITLSLLMGRVGSVYIGLSGSNGQIYDEFFIFISRVFSRKIYLHHHSYKYINKFSWLAFLLFATAGKRATHIVACKKMANDLKVKYPVVNDVRIISGIVALDKWQDHIVPRTKINTVGFLSNISIEKGILEFLDIAERAKKADLSISFIIAGPYFDQKIKELVENRVRAMHNVTYIGSVYGQKKQDFYSSIDVYLFPTRNESEGLVIHEAMSQAIPVISYNRGCIEQIISDKVGKRFAVTENYVDGAIDQITKWVADSHSFHRTSCNALKQYQEAKRIHTKRIDSLCAELVA